jgi:hypothetical protein
MFRTTTAADAAPVAEPTHDVVAADLVPLSVLELDLAAPSVGGWTAYLAGRGIAVVLDDIGRSAVTRADARRLITERRESAARQHEAAERQAIELDQRWRAQLPGGVPASLIPEGVRPAAAMLQAAHDARPRRLTPLQEALSNSGS